MEHMFLNVVKVVTVVASILSALLLVFGLAIAHSKRNIFVVPKKVVKKNTRRKRI